MGILDDNREIFGIWYDDVDGTHYSIESGLKIVPYPESGTYKDLVYYAVFDQYDNIIARVPGWKVTVTYVP